jgi:hypothetical protein
VDRNAYPTTIYDGQPRPWPEWACRSPAGGIHVDARRGSIDVKVAKAPNNRDELNWTCDFQITVVADSWLSQLEDLIDDDRVALGKIIFNEKNVEGWSTIHERTPPSLLATEGRTNTCEICGASYTTIHRGAYFTDPTAAARLLIVNQNGLFVREDVARGRNLRTPSGAFKPRAIKLKPT